MLVRDYIIVNMSYTKSLILRDCLRFRYWNCKGYAKWAVAQGRSTRREELPHLLQSSLPVSVSAAKQRFQANLNRRWAKIWTESPRKERFSRIDPDFPFNKFRKKLFKLSRNQSSLIMQLRTGHMPLIFYLNKTNASNVTTYQESYRLQKPYVTSFSTARHTSMMKLDETWLPKSAEVNFPLQSFPICLSISVLLCFK